MTGSDTVPLHFERSGEGRALIVLHGLFGSLANWRPVSRELSEAFQVFAVDQRNHGRSPHDESFNYTVLAEDLRAFMRQQSLASAYLLGHSLGGKTAMQFALTYPELVDKLIIVDMSPRATRPRHHAIIAALQSLDLSAASSRRDLDAQLAPHIRDAAMRQFLLMNVTTGAAGQLRWRMNLDVIARHYDEVNRAIESPRAYDKAILFIRGEKSDYIQEQDRDAIARLFPRYDLATVADAGHWVQAEAPAAFTRLVLDFLK